MGRIKIGDHPMKGKASFRTRCFMKWKRIQLEWKRWRDPEIRRKKEEMRARQNPFHPSNRRK